jgi:uncharacterized membrane protein YphA (DoxX/SURF4 family)
LLLRFGGGLSLADVAHLAGDLAGAAEVPVRCFLFGIALLIWVGLWTPFAAVAGAAIQIFLIFFTHRFDLSLLVFGAVVLSLAMLGPGAWSLDARLFGRKRIM